jgi:hypothetical protein
LRLRAVQAGMTAPFAAPGETASPFGDTPAGVVVGPAGDDPFAGGADSPFGAAPTPSAATPAPRPAPPPAPTGPVPPGFNEAETQERPIPEPIPGRDDATAAGYRHDDAHGQRGQRDEGDERDAGGPPGLPPTEATQPSYRFDPDPFDPFGEGS